MNKLEGTDGIEVRTLSTDEALAALAKLKKNGEVNSPVAEALRKQIEDSLGDDMQQAA